MIGDACIDLADAGVLTGARKRADLGKLVGGVVLGTRRVFDWIDHNPDVLMVPAAYSHGAAALARVEGLVAINSVIEVALDGSANAEQIGSRVVSGPGGQPDYALGARLSPGGMSMIAISSTTGRTPISRIVGGLAPGVPVTVPRTLADRVVTEFGVARLAGATLDERADRLRAVAHPDLVHHPALTRSDPGWNGSFCAPVLIADATDPMSDVGQHEEIRGHEGGLGAWMSAKQLGQWWSSPVSVATSLASPG